jgi:hypothetical protein
VYELLDLPTHPRLVVDLQAVQRNVFWYLAENANGLARELPSRYKQAHNFSLSLCHRHLLTQSLVRSPERQPTISLPTAVTLVTPP